MNFVPHDYQAYAIDYIETHPIARSPARYGSWKNSHFPDCHR